MAKKKVAQAVDWMTPRFQGKSFFFAGRFEKHRRGLSRDWLDKLVTTEGGSIVDKLTADTSYLVMREPTGASSLETKVAQLNAKGASIEVITDQLLRDLFLPTNDKVSAMLLAGPKGHRRLEERLSTAGYESRRFHGGDLAYVVKGLVLNGQNIENVPLWCATLEDADLRDSLVVGDDEGVDEFRFGPLKCGRLDGAKLKASFTSIDECSCRKADLSRSWLGGYNQHARCSGDFTGSKLIDFHFGDSDLSGSNFTKADLTDSNLEKATAKGTCFRSACLTSIRGKKATFSGSDFSKANLSNAELFDADFEGCNLTAANLQGATLMNANFKNACVDGANFTGANVADAVFDGVDVSKAKGLATATQNLLTAGPKLKELSELAKKAQRLRTSIEIETNRQTIRLAADAFFQRAAGSWSKDLGAGTASDWRQVTTTLADAVLSVAALWPQGTLRCHTIKAEGTKVGLVNKKLKQLALEAWCETFGATVPDMEQIKQQKSADENRQQNVRDTLLSLLNTPAGVLQWNAPDHRKPKAIVSFPSANLAGKKLDQLDLWGLNFEQGNFEGASLVEAQLCYASYNKSNFRGANLSRLNGNWGRFNDCDFTGANLSKANLQTASLARSNLTNTDLSGANLKEVSLIGANLTSAKLSSKKSSAVDFSSAVFDEATVFPKGFEVPATMTWGGQGVDPRARQAIEEIQAAGTIDMPQFMKVLEASVDTERLCKALAMLKAERFRLFAQAAGDHLVGVVKSQGDPDLVYSCRLTKDGDFACCTQNLNVCGGLRGALCKHILVLLIGMANGGEVDPTIVNQWVTSSRFKKPVLDKDVMSETLLRYKGAEAGDVDWRPVETIPEDYYTL